MPAQLSRQRGDDMSIFVIAAAGMAAFAAAVNVGVLLADTVAGGAGLDWIDVIVKLANAGGFGLLAWYLIVKHLPNLDKQHREERAAFRSDLANLSARIEELAKELRK